MRTYIKVDANLRKDLMSIFTMSRKSVWKALNGLTASERSSQVRQYALANGGRYVREDYLPTCRTHETEGDIIQEFEGGITVIVHTEDSTAAIMRGEVELECFEKVTLNMWSNILRLAQAYADGEVEKIAN
ncbi:MAG: hypothetical protein IJM41_00770 [Bacteroidales bacterium]|nr:hypothetical protein [Bacteroidales bacterium]